MRTICIDGLHFKMRFKVSEVPLALSGNVAASTDG